jgi:Amidases related to nicotinamidase
MQRYGPHTALVVVDVQNDFADPNGSLSVPGGEAILATVNREISRARAGHGVVVATQDWHPERTPHFATDGGPWPVHCVGGTWGADLHPSLELPANAPRVRKGVNGEDGYSGFTMRDSGSGETIPTELERLLRAASVGAVVVVGLATDYCVKATALDAAALGFETVVLADGVAAVDLGPGDGDRALEALRAAGVRVRLSVE